MTNLVTRLRDISFNGLRLDEIGYKIIDEAADEIERQQSELKLQREWRERAESDLASAQEQIGRLRHGLDTVVRWSEPNTRVREICEETLAGRQHEPKGELPACECLLLDKKPSAYHAVKCPRYVEGLL